MRMSEATRALGFASDNYTRKLIRSGRLEAVKDELGWDISQDSIIRYLQERRRKGQAGLVKSSRGKLEREFA